MIVFDSPVSGKPLGTLKRVDGQLECSTPEVEELVRGKQTTHNLSDDEVYEWYRSGALDTYYLRATEVAA